MLILFNIYIDTLCCLKTRLHLTLSLGQKKKKKRTLFIAKSKISCLRTCMLACLACLHAWRVHGLTCLACLLVFMSLRARMSYMLAVLKYLTCLVLACFLDMVCPIFFIFEKLTSKNPYIEKFLFIQRTI